METSEMTLLRRLTATAFLMVASSVSAFAGNLPELNLSNSGLALRGYDPVAYFTEGEPREGNAELAVSYKGGTYHFASQEHQDLFVANPDKYLPAYGGYCAYGTAVGVKVDGDPSLWTIVDGRLYLNINRGVDRTWRRDKANFISQADANWPGLKFN